MCVWYWCDGVVDERIMWWNDCEVCLDVEWRWDCCEFCCVRGRDVSRVRGDVDVYCGDGLCVRIDVVGWGVDLGNSEGWFVLGVGKWWFVEGVVIFVD